MLKKEYKGYGIRIDISTLYNILILDLFHS